MLPGIFIQVVFDYYHTSKLRTVKIAKKSVNIASGSFLSSLIPKQNKNFNCNTTCTV